MEARVDALSHTAFSAMPTTGSAVYTGFAEVTVPPATGDLANGLMLLGDLSLTADFGAETIQGEITDIQGRMGGANGAEFDAEGIIAVGGAGGGSQIGNAYADPPGSLLPNSWLAAYFGTLQTPMGEMLVYGQVNGQFEGTLVSPPPGVSPVRALAGTDQYTTIVLDGQIVNGTSTMVAEN